MAEVHNGDDVKDQVEDLTSEEVVTKYRTAAEIANDAIKAVVAKAQAGAKIVELCQVGDKLITDRTGGIFNKTKGDKKISKGIAFPTCVSVNNTVGHFSPLANSEAELKAGDVVKIDLGVQIDGYPVVVAHTVQVPPTAESKESDPAIATKIANLMHGTNTAMEAALRKLVVGGKNSDVTAVLGKVAEEFKINVVQGVLSHNMSRFLIDGEKVILSKADPDTRVDDVDFGLNEVWALDIVMSTGDGRPKQVSDKTTVFKRANDVRYQLKLKASNYVITEVNKSYPFFPFSLRALDEKLGRLGIVECLNHGLVQDYPVLLENEGEYVAHIKATVLLLPSGPARITSTAFDLSAFKTELKVEDPDLKALLATSYKKKKKSGKKNKKEGTAETEAEKDE